MNPNRPRDPSEGNALDDLFRAVLDRLGDEGAATSPGNAPSSSDLGTPSSASATDLRSKNAAGVRPTDAAGLRDSQPGADGARDEPRLAPAEPVKPLGTPVSEFVDRLSAQPPARYR